MFQSGLLSVYFYRDSTFTTYQNYDSQNVTFEGKVLLIKAHIKEVSDKILTFSLVASFIKPSSKVFSSIHVSVVVETAI